MKDVQELRVEVSATFNAIQGISVSYARAAKVVEKAGVYFP